MQISVAMCTCNGARYLREQLDSIDRQSLHPDELVVTDDRSTDDTRAIIQEFAATVPFAVRFFENERKLGPAANFEKAIRLCRGDLIALCDQDDLWYPDKLLLLAQVLEADSALGGVFSDATLMDKDSRISDRRLWDQVQYPGPEGSVHVEESLVRTMCKHDVVTGATLMFRAALRDLLLPVPKSWMHDGWIAWMLALYSGIAAVEAALMAYRVRGSQHAGLSPRSPGRRTEQARRMARTRCLTTERQFEDLRAHWIEHPGRDFEFHLRQFDGKLAHLRYRMNLPQNPLQRIGRVAAATQDYLLYTRGLSTMLKDIVVA